VRLKDHLQVPHISTGDLLRAEVAAGTALGLQAKEVMARGDLVSDAILLGMLEDRLSRPDVAHGFILDGYPRNLAQADALGQLLGRIGQQLEHAVQLDVDTELLVERIAGRAREQGRQDDTPEAAACSRSSTVKARWTTCSTASSRRLPWVWMSVDATRGCAWILFP
jgi:adenylate kinase